jgi:hypothetical protein
MRQIATMGLDVDEDVIPDTFFLYLENNRYWNGLYPKERSV